MSDRCSGDCCRDFVLPFGMDEMRERYDAAVQAVLRLEARDLDLEIIRVYRRLIPLVGPFPEGEASGYTVKVTPYMGTRETYHHYTCRSFDPVAGSCTTYDTRPDMCRDYPEYGKGHRCRYATCTWTGHRIVSEKLRVIP